MNPPYYKYIRKRLHCSRAQAKQMAQVYAEYDFPKLKQALDYLTAPKQKKDPEMTAVSLRAKLTPPTIRYCPTCHFQLEYWQGGRGPVWVCQCCKKALTLEVVQ